MKNTGMAAALAGTFTVCMAVSADPLAIKTGIAGILIMVIGLAMVLYQSYRDEEAAEIERRRKKLFRTWKNETDLRKGVRK